MEKQRQSNFELLRIILMVAIPIYHLMLYGGMNNLPYNQLTIPSLLLCSGSAIVADYAFMALSTYFLLSSNNKPILSRFLKLAMQVLLIYMLKMFVLRIVLHIDGTNALFEAFLVKGSWWFIYVYLIILLIYPFLNKIIFSYQPSTVLKICVILGLFFVFNGITYNANILNDLLCFVFTYFVIGYLKRTDFQRYFGIKIKKSTMICIYVVGFIITFLLCLYIKWPANGMDNEVSNEIVRRLVGKYSFIQFIMGIAIFLLFRMITIKTSKLINDLAKNTFYVFLLHETVMAIYWHNDKLKIVDDIIPYRNVYSLLAWNIVYIISAFIFAFVVRKIYDLFFKGIFQKSINWVCKCSFVKKVELQYSKLTQIEDV